MPRPASMKIICATAWCIVVLGTLPAPAQLIPNLGGQRAGISAFSFLKLGVGARGVAMGESFVAVANDVSALHWNPAGLVQFSDHQILFAHTEYIVDIQHEFLGAVYHLTDADALGVAVTSLHMDDMEVTTETQPLGTGVKFSFGDIATSLSYARRMTEQFSFGVTVRYAQETLDMLTMRGVMVDLGTYYRTGLGSTRFAVVISNFGGDVAPSGTVTQDDGNTAQTFQSFSVPTVFKLGLALEPVETEDHRLTTSLQLSHPNDNAENIRLGVEYSWQDLFALRGGIKRTIGQPLFGEDATSDENFTLGAGVSVRAAMATIRLDYAYVGYYRLGSVHRISLGMGL